MSRSLPDGGFDLVSAQYLHSPVAIPRQRILRTAAETLVLGGRLLVVDHGSIAPWSWNQDPKTHFPTPQELATELQLDPTEWLIERADMPHRQPLGQTGRRPRSSITS
uniref:Thioredoxin reductase n=1 Tax=uncultured Nocardioidaceae bacterium TaxID=253824 RepID=A0A6J4KT47_9ACTN|nr:MAG: Thioredoxin reductase [uncultured Nocardioidaceae bacterium]